MLLHYFYRGRQFELHVRWTNEQERSVIFGEIVSKLAERHGVSFFGYVDMAQELDKKVNRLYRLIYIFNDEHYAIPYDPKLRNQFIHAYSGLSDEMDRQSHLDATDERRVLLELFTVISDKLQEIVGVYLLDNTYQGKHRYRRKNLEEWAETVDENQMSYEFESVLLQMTDISRMLEHLTETQRRRLVQHIFLGHTLQEIAKEEQVSKQSVEESVTAALKKLRNLL